MENTKYGKRREGRWTPIRAKAQDTRANPNSWETHLVRKRWDIGLLWALSPWIMMMMMMKVQVYVHGAPTVIDYNLTLTRIFRLKKFRSGHPPMQTFFNPPSSYLTIQTLVTRVVFSFENQRFKMDDILFHVSSGPIT